MASRSLVFRDMTKGLRDLEEHARRIVCLGAWDEPARNYDRAAAWYIGYERPGYGCYCFIMNELMDLDRRPELRFIHYTMTRRGRFESFEELCRSIRASFRYPLTDEQEEKLGKYLKEHARKVKNEKGIYGKLDHGEKVSAAHIRWNVQ